MNVEFVLKHTKGRNENKERWLFMDKQVWHGQKNHSAVQTTAFETSLHLTWIILKKKKYL